MQQLEHLFEAFLAELIDSSGRVAFQRFADGNELDLKIAEFRTLLAGLSPESRHLIARFDRDDALRVGTPEQRVRILATYAKTALKLLKSGIVRSRGTIVPAPDFSPLTSAIPGLESILRDRWLEIQTCLNAGACLSSVILMGSVLEALLLSRALLSPGEVSRAKRAPAKGRVIQDWNLSELIAAALELGWIKIDPVKFSFPLRKYRRLVHPGGEVSANVDLGAETCEGCWSVLNQAVEELLNSV